MDAADEAAKREAEAHGCCCKRFKLVWELYFAIGLDVLILVAGSPALLQSFAPVPYRAWLAIYLFGVVVPSICVFTAALTRKTGAPRLFLARFLIIYKIPMYFLLYSTFFTISPWAAEVANFMCDPKFDFEHGKVFKMFEHNGRVDVAGCVGWLPYIMVPSMIPRLIIYLYSFKGAWEYMRCHPDNDGKGVFSSGVEARNVTDGYESLDVA